MTHSVQELERRVQALEFWRRDMNNSLEYLTKYLQESREVDRQSMLKMLHDNGFGRML